MDQLSDVAVRLIRNVPFFKGLKPAELLAFLDKARQATFKSGQVIFQEGDDDKPAMYVIVRGSVEIAKQLPDGGREVIGTLGGGECFGEMALADKQPRSATAAAKADTIVLLTTADFLSTFPQIASQLYENLARIIAGRYFELEHEMRSIMRPICEAYCVAPLVDDLPPTTAAIGEKGIETLRQIGTIMEIPVDSYIVRENTVGQYIYVILDGSVEVSRVMGSISQPLAVLERGRYFGETAIVSDEHGRLADVRAIENTHLLRLDADDVRKAANVGAVLYKELARVFSMRLRRATLIHMQTIGRGCYKGCLIRGV